MNDITVSKANLPTNIDDLAKFALIGREKLVAVRAEIRAIEKVGLAQEVREQKLREAQDISEAVLDAEVRIGELMAKVPKVSGGDHGNQYTGGKNDTVVDFAKSKADVIREAGFTPKQVERFQTLAAHPEIVEQAKAEARENDDIVSRSMVLNKVKEKKEEAKRKEPEPTYSHYSTSEYEDRRMHYLLDELMQEMGADDEWEEPKHEPPQEPEQHKPHVSYNSGNNEWYTPADIIEAARKTMGGIDLDPATSEVAQDVVKATTYYTAETNGLDKPWSGRVWMNPPYASELIGQFVDKLIAELPNIEQAIVLVNNATETEWFNKLVDKATMVCFPKSRIKFYMPDGKTGTPLQGQAILYFGDNASAFSNEFRNKGWLASIV